MDEHGIRQKLVTELGVLRQMNNQLPSNQVGIVNGCLAIATGLLYVGDSIREHLADERK